MLPGYLLELNTWGKLIKKKWNPKDGKEQGKEFISLRNEVIPKNEWRVKGGSRKSISI